LHRTDTKFVDLATIKKGRPALAFLGAQAINARWALLHWLLFGSAIFPQPAISQALSLLGRGNSTRWNKVVMTVGGDLRVNAVLTIIVLAGLHPTQNEESDVMAKLREIEIHDYARQLLDARGETAVAEAAQKALQFEQQGENEQAETWRHIEAAIRLMRGPHES
jgi:hypothetical protein